MVDRKFNRSFLIMFAQENLKFIGTRAIDSRQSLREPLDAVMDWKKRGIDICNRVPFAIGCDFLERRGGFDGKGANEERRARTTRS